MLAPVNSLPSMLNPELARKIDEVLAGLGPAELHWLSGYTAGLAAGAPQLPAAPAVAEGETLAVFYGSQTGHGEGVASRLAAEARAAGLTVELKNLAEVKPAALKKLTHATFVVSTHGEGEPPDDAQIFHEALLSSRAPKLVGLNFSVLALGDSSYANFCQTGREFDARLVELGATRLVDLVECDVDYENAAADWTQKTLERLPTAGKRQSTAAHLHAVPKTPRYTRNNPFEAEVLAVQALTGRDSSKRVVHVELSLEGSGIRYQPGDSLGVWPVNPPQTVDRILELTGVDGHDAVVIEDESLVLREALAHRLEVTALSRPFLVAWLKLSASPGLSALLDDDKRTDFAAYLDDHQVVDVIRDFRATPTAQELADALRKLASRSYSIASSQDANPDEAHLTVSVIEYEAWGEPHFGAASTCLGNRLSGGDRLRVFVEENTRFRLPADPDAAVIMIGPGTGVAPFRAFVEERAEQGAKGKNWLFFGERNFSSDFLYQLEWQRHLKSGALTRLSLAFSRDSAGKIYVQDRIREAGAELSQWLRDGAYLYVCGDSSRMAPDVNQALIDVIAEHDGLSFEQAEQQLRALRQQGRYQRDVY